MPRGRLWVDSERHEVKGIGHFSPKKLIRLTIYLNLAFSYLSTNTTPIPLLGQEQVLRSLFPIYYDHLAGKKRGKKSQERKLFLCLSCPAHKSVATNHLFVIKNILARLGLKIQSCVHPWQMLSHWDITPGHLVTTSTCD